MISLFRVTTLNDCACRNKKTRKCKYRLLFHQNTHTHTHKL